MADKIKLVRDDTRPQVKVVISDENSGVVVSLVDATVVMRFRAVGTTEILTEVAGQLLQGIELEDGSVNSDPPYNVAGSGGRVVFLWQPGDLDVEPGEYEGEIEVSFPDGTIQTVYDPQKFKVREDF